MTAAELEKHIADTGLLMVAAYNRYERSGCFSDRGEADAWRLQMEAAQMLLAKLAVVCSPGGLTAREVSKQIGVDYIEVQRRISECGLIKTDIRRDGCAVWRAA